MKLKTLPNAVVNISLITMVLFVFAGCQKGLPDTQQPSPESDPANSAARGKHSPGSSVHIPPYNLDVSLRGEEPKRRWEPRSLGFVEFRQNPDTARIITLETWVINLKPRHAYLLERAVNPITDNSCTSTTWLILGKGLVPAAIHTDFFGFGKADLFRDITSLARGTEFNIHFQIVDSVTKETVLTSDCLQYTVR